jgi:hypothetical protein
MKNIIIGLTLLASISSFASEVTIEDKANLTTLKMMVEVSRDSLNSLSVETNERLAAFNRLGPFSLSAKSKIQRENCGKVKATLGSSLLMFATSLEQSKEALKKLDLTDEESSDLESGLRALISKSKEAAENCDNIAKSVNAIEEARVGVDRALVVLEKIYSKGGWPLKL